MKHKIHFWFKIENVYFDKHENSKMWILSKLWFWKCKFRQNWDFENVNFDKIEISKMWILFDVDLSKSEIPEFSITLKRKSSSDSKSGFQNWGNLKLDNIKESLKFLIELYSKISETLKFEATKLLKYFLKSMKSKALITKKQPRKLTWHDHETGPFLWFHEFHVILELEIRCFSRN